MRFFTLEGWIADQEIDKVNVEQIIAIRRAYDEYLTRVSERLPQEWLRFHRTIVIGDARLRELDVNLPAGSVSLLLDAEDAATGADRRVRLDYEDTEEVLMTSDPERGLPGPHGFGDVGNDEIEWLGDQQYEHRFLFSSGIELTIRFQQFRFRVLCTDGES
jgi:hypothetical protein